VQYISDKYSRTLFDESNGLKFYEKDTVIYFGTPMECSPVGYINLVNVNPLSRGNGFGKGMVEAIERIFRKTGKIAACPVIVTNRNFWGKMGYKVSKDGRYGIKDLI
jgi:GNAT superfamily N-acetyltransferase